MDLTICISILSLFVAIHKLLDELTNDRNVKSHSVGDLILLSAICNIPRSSAFALLLKEPRYFFAFFFFYLVLSSESFSLICLMSFTHLGRNACIILAEGSSGRRGTCSRS